MVLHPSERRDDESVDVENESQCIEVEADKHDDEVDCNVVGKL